MGNASRQLWQALASSMDKFETNMRSVTRLPSLDGLRAASICMVVIGHCSETVRPLSHSATLMLGFVEVSRLGVSVFFVISGFLITTLLVREQQITQSINLKHFYIRRALRIFPGFYAYWLVALALTLLGYIHLSHSDLISSAVYVWNYVPRKADTWFLNHTWSLSIEEQFYLVWPLILKFSGPKRGQWTALAVIIVSPFIRVASYFLLPSARSRIAMMLHTRADSLMVGALLALVFLNEDHLRVLKRLVGSWLIPVASLCFAAIDTLLTVHFQGQYLLTVGYSLQNLAIVLLIAHVVLNDKTTLGRRLNNPAVVHVGVISYSLYLWQQLFLKTTNATITGTFPWNIMCAFVVAELSYYLLEKPFLRWRKRFSIEAPEKESTASELGAVRFAGLASA
jgi:peptidoglycan/LPS O-acetylase OafA/YrhL